MYYKYSPFYKILKLKTAIKYILQKAFGFQTYLYIFSLFVIRKLRWDRNEKDFFFFLKMIPKEGVVLDIGANLGVMTYYLARKHANRSVFSFEPIPYNYKNLLRIKDKFALHNVTTFQIALGDKNGTIDMVLPMEKSVRFHGLAHVKDNAPESQNKGELFQAPIHRLDDIDMLNNSCNPITAIKMDVENYEYYVLKGAECLLKKHFPPIYCELWDNENRILVMNFLEGLGYKVFILSKKKLEIGRAHV
jgi:FkbM family methyltransferase